MTLDEATRNGLLTELNCLTDRLSTSGVLIPDDVSRMAGIADSLERTNYGNLIRTYYSSPSNPVGNILGVARKVLGYEYAKANPDPTPKHPLKR